MRALLAAAWVSVLVIGVGQARAAPPPTIDQSLDMQTVSAPKLSPDGRHVVYEQSRTNWDANSFDTDLWLADVGTGERHRLSGGAKSSRDAAWSPDGRWIAFLSDRPPALPDSPADKTQLYVMPAGGGEAQQVTRFEKGVHAYQWAPDGAHIAVSAESPEPKAMKDRKDSFGDYQVFHADYAMVHLWLVTLSPPDAAGRTPPPAEPRLLTPGDTFSVGSGFSSANAFSFSPDGRTIAFSAQRDPDLISNGTANIYTVGVEGGVVKPLVVGGGPSQNPQWSPDGTEIAYETQAGSKYYFYSNLKIAVVSRDGGTARIVDPAFDEDAHLLKWGPGGIYFEALQKTDAGLFVADPKTATTRRINLPGETESQRFSFSRGFDKAAFVGAAANRYPEIYVASLDKPEPVQVTHTGEQAAPFTTATRELVQWKSGDGADVEGVLYKPRDFDPKKTYPLLVVIHGGPTGVDTPNVTPDRYYPVERFVAKGALVLKPNYRGSAGYGAAFRALNVKNLGVGDYADVISGVDALIAKGFVDKTRVGSMGWSEGGYISAFITTSSDRFKAVSVGAGISDWMTYYANTDITPFTPQYLHGTPWDDPEVYRKTSPISYIAKAKTPTLIQHGSLDKRVPIANGFELRQALEDHGVPVKMVIYDGFGHPINKPKQQRAVMEENEAWFSHYIWGEPLPAALTPRPKVEKAAAGN